MSEENGVESPPDSRNQNIEVPKRLHFDDVLIDELGQCGRFQLNIIILVAIPIVMSAFTSDYIFTADAIPHRCQIHECGENSKNAVFEPEWILDAIPETSTGFASCERFASVGGGNGTLDYCPLYLFDKDSRVECNGFVYARNNSVVYDFDLGCRDWLVSLTGTLNSAGTLSVMPFVGFLSDRFGRRIVIIVSIFNMALLGLIRAFSVNYYMYVTLQILQTMLSAGTFSASYILAIEFVSPKYRVIVSATCSSMFAVGQVVVGAVAWLVQPWRHVIMALCIPCFLIVSYYWVLTDSVRWMLSRQKYDKAKPVLEKMARVNKKHISDKSLRDLLNPPPSTVPASYSRLGLLKAIFRSRVLLRRVFTVATWWVAITFMYYGLSIAPDELSSRPHLNYILSYAVEIPGYYIAMLVLDRIGRRPTLSCGFFLGAACSIIFAFIDSELSGVRLTLYLLGKISVSVVLTSVYLFTIELYPTANRHTFLAYSSMIGRVGVIVTPLRPFFAEFWDGIPFVVFGVLGLVAGLLVLTQPETLGQQLPDTLAEAEAIGRS